MQKKNSLLKEAPIFKIWVNLCKIVSTYSTVTISVHDVKNFSKVVCVSRCSEHPVPVFLCLICIGFGLILYHELKKLSEVDATALVNVKLLQNIFKLPLHMQGGCHLNVVWKARKVSLEAIK